MPNLHPNMNLLFDLDATWDSPEARAELKRSYAFVVGNMELTRHEAAEGEPVPENAIDLRISLHSPYWDGNDEGANRNWPGFKTWLDSKLRKVSSVLVGVNAAREKKGDEPFAFGWMVLDLLSNLKVEVHLKPDSSVDRRTMELVEEVRARMAAGELGTGRVARVTVPSRPAFQEQLRKAIEEEAAAAAAAQAEAEAAERAAVRPAENAVSADAPAEECEAAPDDCMAEPVTETETETGEAPSPDAAPQAAPKHPLIPQFEIDYAVWDVEYADGTVARFDSRTGELRRG